VRGEARRQTFRHNKGKQWSVEDSADCEQERDTAVFPRLGNSRKNRFVKGRKQRLRAVLGGCAETPVATNKTCWTVLIFGAWVSTQADTILAVQVARGIERHQSAVFVGQALHATVTAPFCARCCGRDAIEGMFAGLRGGSVAKFTRFSSTFGRERKADLGLISQRRTLFAVPFQFAVCLGLAIAFNTIPRRAKGATDHIGPLLVKAGS